MSLRLLIFVKRTFFGQFFTDKGLILTSSLVDNSDDKAVDTEDTSHNAGNERLEDKVVSEDTDGADTDTGFGSAVGSTEVGEHQGGSESHKSEEGVLVDSLCYH